MTGREGKICIDADYIENKIRLFESTFAKKRHTMGNKDVKSDLLPDVGLSKGSYAFKDEDHMPKLASPRMANY